MASPCKLRGGLSAVRGDGARSGGVGEHSRQLVGTPAQGGGAANQSRAVAHGRGVSLMDYGEWRSVPGCNPERTLVSSKGWGVKKTPVPAHTAGGYCRTQAGSKTMLLHRVIKETFHGKDNDPRKNTVDHINKVRSDNRLKNLRWATSEEQALNQNRSGMPIEHAPVVLATKDSVEYMEAQFHADVASLFA